MAQPGSFSPDSLTVVISSGEFDHILTNYAEGSFITISPATESWTPTVGAQGEDYRVHQPSRAVTVTVNLSQTSHSNDILYLLHELDRESKEGFFNMTIKDISGTTLYTDQWSYIQTRPEQAFTGGGTLESREWQIRMPSPDENVGGNGTFSVEDQQAYTQIGGTIAPRWQA